MTLKTVYVFGGSADHSDPRQKDKTVAGGKGANLAEMASIGLPVPPGFTITTEECVTYLRDGAGFSDGLNSAVAEALNHVEATVGKRFGDAADPLLVSVRSGARVSMPGMMDTVLNLGLNDATVEGLAVSSGDARFAWDSYRRFIQMYSDVVLGIDHGLFEEALEIVKEDKGFYNDTELDSDDWQALVAEYKQIVADELGMPFPQDVHEQLWGAIRAVFDSWDSDRAKVYRRLNDIPGDWGTAVNVQAMVFGNMGETSATGVAFTRDPATGERAYYGEYLINDKVFSKPAVASRVLKEFRELAVYGQEAAPIFAPLSPREVEILDNIAQGMTNKQVAYALSISEQTVKNHMSSILRKLSVNDRTQAVVYAMRQGWIRMPED